MQLGPYTLRNNVFVAPMAGVTDRPFRQLCKQLGAGYAVSEMAASNPRLWATEKSSRRTDHDGEMEPKAVQIAGADPQDLADCARFNVDRGAQIIDINMGCPVKKVCNSWCGSALLQHEDLVEKILDAVVRAVDVPVTLKFRTGWNRENKNALRIARIAEQAGNSRRGQWRHHDPGKSAPGTGTHGSGRRHDRARGPGPALDLPRDRSFPAHR